MSDDLHEKRYWDFRAVVENLVFDPIRRGARTEAEIIEQLSIISEEHYKPMFEPPARVTVTGGDYTYEGDIVSTFIKKRGGVRYVVEDDNGRLFIHNAKQVGLEP